ncbi:hypothetical protein P175DRAFT_0556410 [Aspergillus ochraceoroseus IBT 24754]|uniref:Uncharacterized protein n=1 Tax=Aspergillus ochraceoroseus IBT 24754 TaxID=1392256 RepID=A0A2T5LYT2_9EURO|nr:uncharacterized protein P175DRAFT_0556410 [Aspergillus ochraceoroseus IBT 24754]PTU21439.1 hypothetical protein P175DRAFT_0556410 [Aspergillus ochraceoroseus IBT 24754]
MEPWIGNPKTATDTNSLVDEEEVIFDLDEVALSQIPIHLQNNMREIQAERAQRLQKEKGCFTRRRNALAPANSKASTLPATDANYKNTHTDSWFQKKVTIDSTRGLCGARYANGQEEHGGARSRPEHMTWCPRRNRWVSASRSNSSSALALAPALGSVACIQQGQVGKSRGGNDCAQAYCYNCNDGLRDFGCVDKERVDGLSGGAATVGGYVAACRKRNQYMLDPKCAGQGYYVYEARACENWDWQQDGQEQVNWPPSRNGSSIMQNMCGHVRRKLQWVGRFMKV